MTVRCINITEGGETWSSLTKTRETYLFDPCTHHGEGTTSYSGTTAPDQAS